MDKTLVSRNHGFLVSLDLLTEGRAKTLTPDGRKLAIAIGNNLDEDAAVEWRRIFMNAPAAKSLVDMLRVQKEIPSNALSGKIAAALGYAGSSAINTGVNSLIEVITKAGVIYEQDGKYRLASMSQDSQSTVVADEALNTETAARPSAPKPNATATKSMASANFGAIPIHVNIELHLPASAEQAVYDALFKSIRENLLT